MFTPSYGEAIDNVRTLMKEEAGEVILRHKSIVVEVAVDRIGEIPIMRNWVQPGSVSI